jgi:cell division protein FtsZ
MDELTEITEYIQEQAGDEGEMIFGHGVDPDLGDRIRVTVIATGFSVDNKLPVSKKEDKKVMDLDRSQGWLFNSANPDNTLNQSKDLEMKTRQQPPTPPKKDATGKSEERELIFSGPFNKIDPPHQEGDDDSLLKDDDFDPMSEKYGDQVINEEGMMELRTTRDRLQQQAKERKEHLKQRKQEMTKEEFNEKWSLPAYLRRGVKMNDVPHSSEPFISKYNLNDDNTLLGNNKFLHDNVD